MKVRTLGFRIGKMKETGYGIMEKKPPIQTGIQENQTVKIPMKILQCITTNILMERGMMEISEIRL